MDVERTPYGDEPAGPTQSASLTDVESTGSADVVDPIRQRYNDIYFLASWALPAAVSSSDFFYLLAGLFVSLTWGAAEVVVRIPERAVDAVVESTDTVVRHVMPVAGIVALGGFGVFLSGSALTTENTLQYVGISIALLNLGVVALEGPITEMDTATESVCRLLRLTRVVATVAGVAAAVLLLVNPGPGVHGTLVDVGLAVVVAVTATGVSNNAN